MPDVREHIPFWTGANLRVMHVALSVRDEIDRAAVARLRESGDVDLAERDGHRLLLREKVAALLGILTGHIGITEDDWRRAGLVLAKSDEARSRVERVLAQQTRERNQYRADVAATAELTKIDRVAEHAEQKVARRALDILRGVAPARMSRRDLSKRFDATSRSLLDTALLRLKGAGLVATHSVARGRRATFEYWVVDHD